MELPLDFKDRMRRQLGDAYGDFLSCYDKERAYGLRCNLLKINPDRLAGLLASYGVETGPVPWAEEGFYYPADAQPGKLPLHEAGAYYIQEPSAMIAVELLDPVPGDRVLDLCAAPGGKSTQIAGRLQGEGLLVSNEIISARAKILSRNIERMGVPNAVVFHETPERLSRRFAAFFDRILVDAPCSGEGMFRKDENARGEWSLKQTEVCAERQRAILEQAAGMLKPGGTLVYSTCTFAPCENEEMADWFQQEFPQFTLERMEHIWPHLRRGEGHFAACFKKAGIQSGQRTYACGNDPGSQAESAYVSDHERKNGSAHRKGRRPDSRMRGILAPADLQTIAAFCRETLSEDRAAWIRQKIQNGNVTVFGDQIYLLPEGIGSLDGLKTERAGLQLGCIRKNRFEPSHALAMALRPKDAVQTLELDDPLRYLRGETVCCGEQKGWTLVTADGCTIGWGKASGGILKNHYPKGIRLMQG